MNLLKNKNFFGAILLIGLIAVLAACSDENEQQDAEDVTDPEQNEVEDETNTSETDESATDDDMDDTNDDAENNNTENDDEDDTIIEHQTGLGIGDTGTVVSGTLSENDAYEVTLNEIKFVDEVEGETIYNEVFIKANVTIKNMEDDALALDAIFLPTVGDENEDDIVLFPAMKEDYYEDDSETELEQEEIEPGESIVADYYFDANEAELYRFSFGNPIDQIVTYVHWEISEDEM